MAVAHICGAQPNVADTMLQAALLLHDTATFRQLRQASCSVHGAVTEAAALTPLLASFY